MSVASLESGEGPLGFARAALSSPTGGTGAEPKKTTRKKAFSGSAKMRKLCYTGMDSIFGRAVPGPEPREGTKEETI